MLKIVSQTKINHLESNSDRFSMEITINIQVSDDKGPVTGRQTHDVQFNRPLFAIDIDISLAKRSK